MACLVFGTTKIRSLYYVYGALKLRFMSTTYTVLNTLCSVYNLYHAEY